MNSEKIRVAIKEARALEAECDGIIDSQIEALGGVTEVTRLLKEFNFSKLSFSFYLLYTSRRSVSYEILSKIKIKNKKSKNNKSQRPSVKRARLQNKLKRQLGEKLNELRNKIKKTRKNAGYKRQAKKIKAQIDALSKSSSILKNTKSNSKKHQKKCYKKRLMKRSLKKGLNIPAFKRKPVVSDVEILKKKLEEDAERDLKEKKEKKREKRKNRCPF